MAGGVALLALAACGRSYLLDGQRAEWRHEAEVKCLESGTVKIGVERIDPIEGPGVCGADFPFKVTALGEDMVTGSVKGYADELRPPGSIPNAAQADMPRWPDGGPRYQPGYQAPPRIAPVEVQPVRPVDVAPAQGRPPTPPPIQGETMRWVPGPQGVVRSRAGAPAGEPAGKPLSINAPDTTPSAPYRAGRPEPYRARPAPPPPRSAARAMPNDIPDDAVIPKDGSAAVPARRAARPDHDAPVYRAPPSQQRREPPRLGPTRAPVRNASIMPARVTPKATLACPLVSALDRWVTGGVQPAALHWFGQQVVEIKQISSYSCRQMNGAGGHGISEHAFGNALDIAAFTLADGRKVTVKDGWHGTPEEQGFLHDVQLYACETFVTVLGPGYNAAHYNHFHVDLMKRKPGYRPCRPEAVRGEVVAARARARYAKRHHEPSYTGSIGAKIETEAATIAAIPGADGYVPDADDGDVTGSIPEKSTRAEPGADGEAESEITSYPDASASKDAFGADDPNGVMQ